MKKRHLLFTVTALLLLICSILPALTTRITYEQNHRGYVTAIALNDTAAHYGHRGAFYAELLRYKANGITTAVLCEREDGSLDADLLELASLAGLDTALCLYAGNEKSLTYEKNLNAIFQKYKVKYLLLKASAEQTQPTPLANLIEKHQITLVLSENKNQLSNETPLGFTEIVAAANGRILRCYETNKTQPGRTKKTYDPLLIYYQMLNSARDRNTEFLLVHQLTDAAATPEENAKITQAAVAKFCGRMQKDGYTPAPAGTLAGYSPHLKSVNAAGAFLGILMLIPMLYILLKKTNAHLEWLLFALAALAYAITWLLPHELVLLYPSLFAPLGACFSFTLCYAAARKLKASCCTLVCTCAVLLLGLVSLLVCCAVLSAMLSGMEYYLNIYIFRGVSVTLLLPVLYALVFLFFAEERKHLQPGKLKAHAIQRKGKIRIWHIAVLVCACLVLTVYIVRSGNTSISALETKVRNVVGEVTRARPRTKEFLIGWPALALFVYYIKQNRSKLLRWVFAAGSAILFASVMNTFCHVFTDVSTSVLRTVNGLVFAIPLILIYSAANRIFLSLSAGDKLDKQADI